MVIVKTKMAGYRASGKKRKIVNRKKKSPMQVTKYCKPKPADYAMAAFQGVKQIYRMINTEYKVLDNTITTAVSNTGTINSLDVIAVGDNVSNRDSISIRPINLTIRWKCTRHATATNTLLRINILRGKGENGVALTIPDVYPGNGPIQPKTYDKRFKTQVLWEKLFQFQPDKTGISGKAVIKLSGHVTYATGTTNGTVKEDGGLYLVAQSDEATNTPTMSVNYRLTFTDN